MMFAMVNIEAEGAPEAHARRIEQAAAARSVPFTRIAIEEPEATALYERNLVLVRPDGHVAWRADAPPADPLALIDKIRGAA